MKGSPWIRITSSPPMVDLQAEKKGKKDSIGNSSHHSLNIILRSDLGLSSGKTKKNFQLSNKRTFCTLEQVARLESRSKLVNLSFTCNSRKYFYASRRPKLGKIIDVEFSLRQIAQIQGSMNTDKRLRRNPLILAYTCRSHHHCFDAPSIWPLVPLREARIKRIFPVGLNHFLTCLLLTKTQVRMSVHWVGGEIVNILLHHHFAAGFLRLQMREGNRLGQPARMSLQSVATTLHRAEQKIADIITQTREYWKGVDPSSTP